MIANRNGKWINGKRNTRDEKVASMISYVGGGCATDAVRVRKERGMQARTQEHGCEVLNLRDTNAGKSKHRRCLARFPRRA